VGRTRAEGIVLERIRRGPFRSLEDLARVDGIGLETIRAIGRYLDMPSVAPAGTTRH
jgi:DNA uptake protein ComE-like DNA-binding protein